MIGVIFLLVIVVVAFVFFASVDSKKNVLNQVGLTYTKQRYETAKEVEYEKKCLKALKNCIVIRGCHGNNEEQFLSSLHGVLYDGVWGEHENNYGWLEVSPHFVKHCLCVVERRQNAIKEGRAQSLILERNFNDKGTLKRYISVLWRKYQYPWPENWIKG